MLELLDQLNRDAEDEVKRAQNMIADLKEQKARRAKELADLAPNHNGPGSREAEDRDELMEELELEERKQDNRLALYGSQFVLLSSFFFLALLSTL